MHIRRVYDEVTSDLFECEFFGPNLLFQVEQKFIFEQFEVTWKSKWTKIST